MPPSARCPSSPAPRVRPRSATCRARPAFTGGQSYSDLRGLGPQRTLVLLDGQRLVPTEPQRSGRPQLDSDGPDRGRRRDHRRCFGCVWLGRHSRRGQLPTHEQFPGSSVVAYQHGASTPRRWGREQRQCADGRKLRRSPRQCRHRSGVQRARRDHRRRPPFFSNY